MAEDTGARPAPAEHLVGLAIRVSTYSPCRSKRGSVIFWRQDMIATGHNYKPRGFECDGTATCKATCRITAVHAEQEALLAAGTKAQGAEMLHVKTVDGQLVPSGGPSCAQCSKLALAAGISAMWLYHEDGWRRYETAEWHRLSLAAGDPAARDPLLALAVAARDVLLNRACSCYGVSGPCARCQMAYDDLEAALRR